MGRRSLGLALSAWAGESELVRRVHRLLRPVGSMGRLQRRVSLGVLAVAVAGGSVELARMPRLVSFVDVAAQSEVARSLPAQTGASAGAARMMPVVYREPVRVQSVASKRTKASRRCAVVRQTDRSWPVVRTARLVSTSQENMVLTSSRARMAAMWLSPAERDRFRAVDAVSTDVPVSYAAVPFANGWLILQL